jgi:transposase
MDVHLASTTFCIFDPQQAGGERYRTLRCETSAVAYRRMLRPYAGRCRVVYEVGTQAQWVAQVLRPLVADLQVANPSRVPWLFRDGRKNDRLDARKLVTLLYLDQVPQVHLPSPDVSSWRALIQHRRRLVQRRTRVKNQIHAILRSFALRCPHKSVWTRVGQAWLKSQSFDVARQLMIGQLLSELALLEQKRRAVEQHLDNVASGHAGVALLQTIPGLGPRTAEAIVAFADELGRFRNRKQFSSYFGMTPTEDSSGAVVRRGRISKRGPSVVRWVLIEATRMAIRYCPAFRKWFERICRGRTDRRKKAVVATGRKILCICFGMLRTGEVFDARRVAA